MTPSATTRRPSVVLVEDDENVAFMLARHLERNDFHVRHAASVAAAHGVLAAGEWDIAVLDRNLPDGDGLDLCAQLRKQAQPCYLVVLTGEDSEESKLAGFEHGADDYVTKPFSVDELIARLHAGARIVALQKELLATNRRLEELSTSDGLTSLQNRRAFDSEFAVLFERARRYQRPLSLAIIDVDRFKSINDTFGHDGGDAVLRRIAEILRMSTRATDVLARVGGEEFALLMPETSLFDAMQAMEKVRATIATSAIVLGGAVTALTVSVGTATVPHSEVSSAAELYRLADQALYRAKSAGRNRVSAERRKRRFASRGPFTAESCSA